jgi:dGTPase
MNLLPQEHIDSISAVVAAACLAHDIGNPPFGHSGEAAIAEFFQLGAGQEYLAGLTKTERAELLAFEGNALGFRLLCNQKPAQTENPGGFSLTYATLGAFSKYPCTADHVSRESGVRCRKFGIFSDDVAAFISVAEALALPQTPNGWSRSPLAFLTEAADDICYRIIDLEDGYKLGLVTYEEIRELLEPVASETAQTLSGLSRICAMDQRVGFLRAKAIHSLVLQCATVFADNASSLMNGAQLTPLLDHIPTRLTLSQVQQLSQDRIYRHRPVLEIEAAGHEVLSGLLQAFLESVLDERKSNRAKKVRNLIPEQYLNSKSQQSRATRILNIAEYVASMTDKYAIHTYRTIKGIELPNYGR